MSLALHRHHERPRARPPRRWLRGGAGRDHQQNRRPCPGRGQGSGHGPYWGLELVWGPGEGHSLAIRAGFSAGCGSGRLWGLSSGLALPGPNATHRLSRQRFSPRWRIVFAEAWLKRLAAGSPGFGRPGLKARPNGHRGRRAGPALLGCLEIGARRRTSRPQEAVGWAAAGPSAAAGRHRWPSILQRESQGFGGQLTRVATARAMLSEGGPGGMAPPPVVRG